MFDTVVGSIIGLIPAHVQNEIAKAVLDDDNEELKVWVVAALCCIFKWLVKEGYMR